MKCCKKCGNLLPPEKQRNIFCSRSCSISFNNRGIRRNFVEGKNRPQIPCQQCGTMTDNSMFCSNSCRAINVQESVVKEIENGTYSCITGSKVFKKYLIEKRGEKCECCLLDKWFGQTIPLNVHHKDGDAKNNKLDNVQLLCLNCHGLTENYGGRNRGKSTRSYRYDKV